MTANKRHIFSYKKDGRQHTFTASCDTKEEALSHFEAMKSGVYEGEIIEPCSRCINWIQNNLFLGKQIRVRR